MAPLFFKQCAFLADRRDDRLLPYPRRRKGWANTNVTGAKKAAFRKFCVFIVVSSKIAGCSLDHGHERLNQSHRYGGKYGQVDHGLALNGFHRLSPFGLVSRDTAHVGDERPISCDLRYTHDAA